MTSAIQWFLIVVLALGPLFLSGQRFQGYLNAGVNFAQIDGDKLAGFNQPGLTGGLQVNAPFNDRWEVSMEMRYSQEGARRNNNDDPSAPYERIRLNFVEVPFMIRFNEWKFQLGAGVSYARLIDFKTIDAFGDDVSSLQRFNANQLSAVLGATVFLTPKSGLNIRWSKHITNLQSDANAPRWIPRAISIQGVFLL